MFKIRKLTLFVFIVCLLLVFTNSASGSDLDDLDDILKTIEEGKNALERLRAQRELYKYLEDISESQRSQDIKRLLVSLKDPKIEESHKYPYRYKVGVYEGIGRMRDFFWHVEGQEEEKRTLYNFFKKERDPTLKKSIEKALMTARGLYWDAINDYNKNRVDDPNSVVKKFRQVFESYPASEFAPKAHYFLARYYIKAYFVLKDNNQNTDADNWINKKSNKVFKSFIKKVKDNSYKNKRKLEANYKRSIFLDFETKKLQEARYYIALNLVLLKKIEEASAQLQKIIDDAEERDHTIYIDKFYPSKKAYKIKRYFNASLLAEKTIEYLNKNPEYKKNYLNLFIEYLNNWKHW